ncbi:hypothetical protein ACWOC1_07740 [Enterococcus quebecensis]|uniref:ParB/Sulfiredoxin domain-containing protein n=1 Tax=Enterococcus quebecensis TaxID=903983 RepID=A0A1E5GUI4_9ENTE|nr:hypothetical protein [Enterococcus quebecensis]OEG16354.1 hypothetical protein BCR23_05550 [Enterococcus quebecensis]OJG72775.1 hypothetical protein RV12_GL000873 [Enterococcus quebecensis]
MMKAWNYKGVIIFGNSDKEIVKDYITKTNPTSNLFLVKVEYFKKKRDFFRDDLQRLPFLDGCDKEEKDTLNLKVLDEKKRLNRLNFIFSKFNPLTEEQLKSLLMDFDEQLYFHSDYSNEVWEEIEVEKISGIMRFRSFSNWYQPFKIVMEGRASAEIKHGKIDRLIRTFEKDETEFYNIYSNPRYKDMYVIYDSDKDKYFVTEDGSHRVFLAKILGMKTIMANVNRVKKSGNS